MSAASHEHQFANPMPAGLGALAIACFGLFALFSGKVSHDAAPIITAWFIGGFVVQVVVAIIEFRDKNLPGANVFLVFSSFFMLTGAINLSTKYYLHAAGLPLDKGVEGWLWMAAAIWLGSMLPCFLKSPRLLFILGTLLDVVVWGIVAIDFGIQPALCAKIVAWLLLISGFIALYLSSAVAINTHLGKAILPTTTPIIKPDIAAPIGAPALGSKG